jgi:hypothetical protein
MKIEKQKIDNMAMKQPIGQVTQNASKQQCQREIAPCVRLPPSHEQSGHNDQRDKRNYNKESIVTPKRSKRCACVGNVNQAEKIGDDNARLVRADQSHDQLLGTLVQRIEWKREKKDELHVDPVALLNDE